MLFLPLRGDKFKTADGDEYITSSYRTFGLDGKTVSIYAKTSGDTALKIHFEDVIEVNGVACEFQSDSHLFESFGIVRRKVQLLQPGDTVKIKVGSDSKDTIVKQVFMKAKNGRYHLGFIDSEGDSHSIKDIVAFTGERKDPIASFLKVYSEYL